MKIASLHHVDVVKLESQIENKRIKQIYRISDKFSGLISLLPYFSLLFFSISPLLSLSYPLILFPVSFFFFLSLSFFIQKKKKIQLIGIKLNQP